MLTFKHKPSLGDIMYSLPAIMALDGGTLFLDPTPHGGCYNKGWADKFELLIPIISQQNYISLVKVYENEPCNIDLDHYLSHHMSGRRDVTIVDAHFRGLEFFVNYNQIKHKYPLVKPNPPWLKAKINSVKEKGEGKRVVFADTGSWRPHVGVKLNFNFLYDLQMLIGKENIYNCTPNKYSDVGVHCPPQNLVEWFEIIDACDFFIGNQSFPLSLAVGFGKTRMIVECGAFPNCTFGHENEGVITTSHDENTLTLNRLTKLCRDWKP